MRIVPQGRKVRYAVVGAGWISQEDFMPCIANTTNSQLTAVVTGDPEKASHLVEKYNLLRAYSYDQFSLALEEGLFDAAYIATPNAMHLDLAVMALEAGCHVLLEKPMETSEAKCEAINAASAKTGAKMMIAYRLHCEPGTVELINDVRNGRLGDPRIFTSVLSQNVDEENHRANNGFESGPVFDVGVYPINAVRNLFGMEPIEVCASGFKSPGKNMDFHDTVSVTMRFPGERCANFICSYGGAGLNTYSIIGTKGTITCEPCFLWGSPIAYHGVIDGKEVSKTFKNTDHFAAEAQYFSECIITNNEPEPNGDEGWRDVRIVCAIKRSLETGQTQQLAPLESRRHPTFDQVREIAWTKRPSKESWVNCEAPSV